MKKSYGRVVVKLLLLVGLCLLCMAPNRKEHDHIGNFNFKVEIEGVTQGAFRMATDHTVACNVEVPEDEVQLLRVHFPATKRVPSTMDAIKLRSADGRTLVFKDVIVEASRVIDDERHLVVSYSVCFDD